MASRGPRGTLIVGWWVWWPAYGAAYARRLETEEDAKAFIPLTKNKRPPFGPKYIMHVGYGDLLDEPEYYGWNHDKPIVVKEEEVMEQWFKMAQENVEDGN